MKIDSRNGEQNPSNEECKWEVLHAMGLAMHFLALIKRADLVDQRCVHEMIMLSSE